MTTTNETENLVNRVKELQKENEELQMCTVCSSEDFKFKIVIDKTTSSPIINKCTLACAQCGTPTTVIGGKLIQ